MAPHSPSSSTTQQDSRVAVIGLGYVGLTLAIALAERGCLVDGIEISPDTVDRVNRGESPVFEPDIDERLLSVVQEKRLRAIPQLTHGDYDIFIITVGTPLTDDGRVRMDMIERASNEIKQVMTPGAMVVLRSTVKLGTTRGIVEPILRSKGIDFDLAFCPERTIEGKAMEELYTLPQIVAGLSPRAVERAEKLFSRLTSTIVRVSSIETGELIKLVDNTSRDVAFGFSNEIARICNLSGADAKEVIEAGKKGYPRTNLPLPGPVGGPCLSKDTYILKEALERFDLLPRIAVAARETNQEMLEEAVRFMVASLDKIFKNGRPKNLKVALLGLAFKGRPENADLRGTTAIPILARLKSLLPEAQFVGFDHRVENKEIKKMGLDPAVSLDAAFDQAHLVAVLNNHKGYENQTLSLKSKLMAKPGLIYDFWNFLDVDSANVADQVFYSTFGSHRKLEKRLEA